MRIFSVVAVPDRFARAERVFARRVFIEKLFHQIPLQIKIRIRFVAVDFADNDLFFARKLVFVKNRKTHRVVDKFYRRRNIRAGRREIIIDDFLARRAVIGDAEIADFAQ